MVRHLVGEATPELEHLREGVALDGPSVSREYPALGSGRRVSVPVKDVT
jgi:hypothetical protein